MDLLASVRPKSLMTHSLRFFLGLPERDYINLAHGDDCSENLPSPFQASS